MVIKKDLLFKDTMHHYHHGAYSSDVNSFFPNETIRSKEKEERYWPLSDMTDQQFVDEVVQYYKDKSGYDLLRSSHSENPFLSTKFGEMMDTNKLLKEEFKNLHNIFQLWRDYVFKQNCCNLRASIRTFLLNRNTTAVDIEAEIRLVFLKFTSSSFLQFFS